MPTPLNSHYAAAGMQAQYPYPPQMATTYLPNNTPYGYAAYASPYGMPGYPQQSPWAGVDPNYSRRQAWMAVARTAEQKAKEAIEQEKREKEEKEATEKKKKQDDDAMRTFWASRGFAPAQKGHSKTPSSGTPQTVNVNIQNLQHGVFGQPQGSPTSSPDEIPPFVPPMFVWTPAPAPPCVNYQSRPTFTPPTPSPQRRADPWSSGKTGPGKEVIDVSKLIASRHTVDIHINPIIASKFGPAALNADLRTAVESIKITDGDKEWKGQDEPLTLPMLSSVVLISPHFPKPLVVSNDSGVTVGDLMNRLYTWSQTPMPDASVSALTPETHTYIEQTGHSLRQPYHPTSVVGPNISWIDMLLGHTVVQGVKRDSGAARDVLGWDHPACFVVELGKGASSSGSPMGMGMGMGPMPGYMMPPGMGWM